MRASEISQEAQAHTLALVRKIAVTWAGHRAGDTRPRVTCTCWAVVTACVVLLLGAQAVPVRRWLQRCPHSTQPGPGAGTGRAAARSVTVTVLAASQGSQDASWLKHAVFLFPPMCSTKTKGERDSSLPGAGAALSCSSRPPPPPPGLQRPCPGLVVLQGCGAACPLLPGWPSPCSTCTSSFFFPPLFIFFFSVNNFISHFDIYQTHLGACLPEGEMAQEEIHLHSLEKGEVWNPSP